MSEKDENQDTFQVQELPKGSDAFQEAKNQVIEEEKQKLDIIESAKLKEEPKPCSGRRKTLANVHIMPLPVDILTKRNSIAFGTTVNNLPKLN